jgi:hypothetical protein
MPPRSLKVNDTPTKVALCEWHLRKIFNEEDFMGKLETMEMKIGASLIRERKNPSKNAPSLADAPYVQEFIIVDAVTNVEVARCQRFLEADKQTPAASKKSDPKQINWKGFDYHQLGNKNPECAHCKAGIPTRTEKQDVQE